ncbi:Serine/threonine-protein phosphatase PP2A catalytic subunit [Tritrichomonas foetus]|uniref:Serine/threonine-protein phosphatase n=1 Tax=Tritrichomonas foetus TaxID=1144522 RepID=A0A1J4KPG2_9EUKA|nr:Serine/threonine-protein phosphatase PP2A catalytic subunit [Tritrichomonas foetus]|eukprot:OHT13193.1 Serine/threonine-protein phosphatase PP2A catalytic subunit [Tritrichomonas foetus]
MIPRKKNEIDYLWKKSAMCAQGPNLSMSEDYLERIIYKFWNSELPPKNEMQSLIEESTKIFIEEPNVLDIKPPITICGDIHGQFDDLLEIFRIGGFPPSTKYLFLGDFVDRGDKGAEVLMLLCALKLKFRDQIFLLRGNHESVQVTRYYGFRDEILIKYRSESLYKAYESLFNSLPIAAKINNKIFCVHGGLAENVKTIEEIQKINRFIDIPASGPLCELLWNDPVDFECMFGQSTRNAGKTFGALATNEFISKNGISLIVRAHEPKMEGYEYCQNNRVLTLFSAPNYDPGCEPNKGAIMIVDENMGKNIIKFPSAPPLESDFENLRNFVY